MTMREVFKKLKEKGQNVPEATAMKEARNHQNFLIGISPELMIKVS